MKGRFTAILLAILMATMSILLIGRDPLPASTKEETSLIFKSAILSLLSNSKIFSGSSTQFGAQPNEQADAVFAFLTFSERI